MNTTNPTGNDTSSSTHQHVYSYSSSYRASLPSYIALAVVDAWILLSVVVYGYKTGKWRQLKPKNSEKLNSGLIYTSVVVCGVLCLVYHVLISINHHSGYDTNDLYTCGIEVDFLKAVYGSVVLTVNVFLWLRQRVFYTSLLAQTRCRSLLNVFSRLTVVIIFFGVIVGIVTTALPNDSLPSPIGCVYKPDSGDFRVISLYVAAFIVVFGQVSMVSLLIYGLVSAQENTSKSSCAQLICCNKHSIPHKPDHTFNESESLEKKVHLKTLSGMHPIILKTIIFAILSLVSDTTVLTLDLQLHEPNTRGDLTAILTCLAVFLNLLFMIFSFEQWKEMLSSPCRSHLGVSKTRSDSIPSAAIQSTV